MYRRLVLGSIVAILIELAAPAPAVSAETGASKKEIRELEAKLWKETQLVLRQASGPAAEFKPDEDPNTLEMVFLASKKDGRTGVTTDGEVIFLAPGTGPGVQGDLMRQAFHLRALRRANGAKETSTTPPAAESPSPP